MPGSSWTWTGSAAVQSAGADASDRTPPASLSPALAAAAPPLACVPLSMRAINLLPIPTRAAISRVEADQS
jgi:hypothetical protein